MQFDHDLQSPYADLFLRVRDLLLGFDEIHEVTNPNQTTYKETGGYAVCLMRTREDGLHLVFAQGAKLEGRYPELRGDGKVVRYLLLHSKKDMDEETIKAMIEESLVLTLEQREMRTLRACSRR